MPTELSNDARQLIRRLICEKIKEIDSHEDCDINVLALNKLKTILEEFDSINVTASTDHFTSR